MGQLLKRRSAGAGQDPVRQDHLRQGPLGLQKDMHIYVNPILSRQQVPRCHYLPAVTGFPKLMSARSRRSLEGLAWGWEGSGPRRLGSSSLKLGTKKVRFSNIQLDLRIKHGDLRINKHGEKSVKIFLRGD